MYIRNLLNQSSPQHMNVHTSRITIYLPLAIVISLVLTCATTVSAFAEDDGAAAVTALSSATTIDSASENSESTYAIDLFLPFVTSANTKSQAAAPVVVADSCEAISDDEQRLGDIIVDSPSQQRDFMACNPILSQVARARAVDMAARNYFGHTNPDGIGPNTLVRAAGYRLPSFYASAQDGNNIESIAAGYTSAEAAFEGWLNSSGHRTHMLGEIEFYRDQVEFGVGYYYDANSTYKHYWVLLSAYEE